MRTCVWCDAPLPEPEHKGHRRREFCKPPKTCKQQHYLWHKQMKHDADHIAEPYWRTQYTVLVEHYKYLETNVQARLIELEDERKRADNLEELLEYYREKFEALRIDYVARLRALNMSDTDIEEFNIYWKKQQQE